MRKVSCVCCYEGNTLYSLTAITRNGVHHHLYPVRFGEDSVKWFPTFKDMYEYIIKLCHYNGFTMNHYTAFSAEWYDILFYKRSLPQIHNKYGLPHKDVETASKGGESND